MPRHMDDEDDNPDPRVAHLADLEGINVGRVIVKEVGSGDTSSFEREMRDIQSIRRGLTDVQGNSSNNDDDGDGGGGGGGDDEEGYREESAGDRCLSPFTGDDAFTHATLDEDHGCMEAGVGTGAFGRYYTRRRNLTEGCGNPSDDDSLTIRFDLMSLGSQKSNNSNESYASSQIGGVLFANQSYASASWGYSSYPVYGGIVGSIREIYEFHVQTYIASHSASMTWTGYCMGLNGARYQDEPARHSFWW